MAAVQEVAARGDDSSSFLLMRSAALGELKVTPQHYVTKEAVKLVRVFVALFSTP